MTVEELPQVSPEAYQAALEERFLSIRDLLGRTTTTICQAQIEHSGLIADHLGEHEVLARELRERWHPPLIQATLEARYLTYQMALGQISATLSGAQAEFNIAVGQHSQVLHELRTRWDEHRGMHPAPWHERCEDCETYDPAKLESSPVAGDEDVSPAAEGILAPDAEAA